MAASNYFRKAPNKYDYFSDPKVKGETKAFLKPMRDQMLKKATYGLIRDREIAERMQTFLNALKNTSQKKDKSISKYISDGAIESLRSQLPSDIFRIASKEHSTKGQPYDDVFERDLNIVFSKLANTTQGNYYDGTKTATTVIADKISKKLLKDIEEALDKDFVKKINQDFKAKASKEEAEKSIFEIPSARSQKSDITTIVMTTALDPEYEDIVDLFKGYRFTIKNYGSEFAIGTGGITVELGSSNPMKAFVGVLTSFGISQSLAIKAFFASAASYYRDPDSELADLIFAIRFYYELTGVGLIVDGQKLSEVDFIIVNNPNGRIIVRSTKEILYSVLSSTGADYTSKYDPYRIVKRLIPWTSVKK